MKLSVSEVKAYAMSVGLPVFQPAGFREDAAVEELRALRPDLILVVAYGGSCHSGYWTSRPWDA